MTTDTRTALSADSSISTWLADPVGGALLREHARRERPEPRCLPPRQPARHQAPREDEPRRVLAGAAGRPRPSRRRRRGARGRSAARTRPPRPPASAPSVPQREWSERVDQGRFTGKTVIVTGAGSGIGRATASRIAREGGRVVAVDVSQERLDEFVAEHAAADIVSLVADITSDEGIARIVEAAGGTIDALANIAGIMDDMTPVGELTDAVWERVMNVNVTGTMKMMRAVVPAMLAQGYGSIVNTASEAALRGSAAGAAYTASKHAVVGLTKSSAFMYGPSGIRVNAVAPGPTITNIEAKFASPLGAERVQLAMTILPEAAEAEALAASITFLLSDDGVNINGVTLASDGGWSAA